MFFLFGEKTRAETKPVGTADCGVCGAEQTFLRVSESVWFTAFAIPVARLSQEAEYDLCTTCQNAFHRGDYAVPSHISLVREVLAYILVGYGMHEHRDVAQDICQKLTRTELSDEELTRLIRRFDAGNVDIEQRVSEARPTLNSRGRQEIVAAAFLMAYASCELEYEDRLRINLMGTALGLDLVTVDAIIRELRGQGYLGTRRFLPTMKA